MFEGIQFNHFYFELVKSILNRGVMQSNKRTGEIIWTTPGGVSALICFENCLPIASNRKLFPTTAAAEVLWYLSGSTDVTWLRNKCRIWDEFVEDDGLTISNAYGYRWRKHFGRDQIKLAIVALQEDPSDRQVLVSAWDPALDGLGNKGVKNTPCPTHFTFSIIEGLLYSSLFIRSSDVFVGLPYDVMGHAILMDMIAVELRVGIGDLHLTLAHPHLYDKHVTMARDSMGKIVFSYIPFIQMPLSLAEQNPDAYLHDIAQATATSDMNPLLLHPEIIL
jgi:thymidylate synthase